MDSLRLVVVAADDTATHLLSVVRSTDSAAAILFDDDGGALMLQRGSTAPWMPLRWNLAVFVAESYVGKLAVNWESCAHAWARPRNKKVAMLQHE